MIETIKEFHCFSVITFIVVLVILFFVLIFYFLKLRFPQSSLWWNFGIVGVLGIGMYVLLSIWVKLRGETYER